MTVEDMLNLLIKLPRNREIMVGIAESKEKDSSVLHFINSGGKYVIKENDRIVNFDDTESHKPGADERVFVLWV